MKLSKRAKESAEALADIIIEDFEMEMTKRKEEGNCDVTIDDRAVASIVDFADFGRAYIIAVADTVMNEGKTKFKKVHIPFLTDDILPAKEE